MSKMPLPLLIFLLFCVPFEVISQSSDSELSILFTVKQQLGDPTTLSSWNSSGSPCDWPGITCVGSGVTGVSLRDKNITIEGFPAAICELKNLTILDLYNNSIYSEFPKSLYNCSKLEVLDLSQNYFSGPIPGDIDRISSLQYLDLSGNSFSGQIPPAIGRLPELKTLCLHQSEYNGTIPKEIGDLSNLETLFLAFNDKFSPGEIPPEFGKLKKLKSLWMKNTNLVGEIPRSFANLSSMEILDLSVNDLVGEVPPFLFQLKNLTEIYLFHNYLSGQIPDSIEALDLAQIDLSMNNLTGSIPEVIGTLQNLDSLILYSNRLSGEVPASIGLLPKMKDFRVFSNRLSGTLPPELGSNSKLEAFEVSDNQFSGRLPANICAGGVLEGVIAFKNNLSGPLPASLGSCNSLHSVQLYQNNFSGEIPAGLWAATNVYSLMLSSNSFTGEFPRRLAWNLSRVEISNNKFSGEIPASISKFQKLAYLEASNNLFSGKLSPELTKLPSLINLLLDGNQFSGELPSEIASWNSLVTLNLSRNRFTGGIPAALGSLPDLLNLDLSENQFSGKIPPEVGKLRLTFLNVSSNRLSGKIPDQLDSMAYEQSFLDNLNLCADTPIISLPSCSARLAGSSRLSSKNLAMVLVLAVIAFLVSVFLTLLLARDYQKKKKTRELAAWKLTSFQRLNFTEATILSSLTDNNLIGSGGSGKVYRTTINRSGECLAVKKIWSANKLDHNLEKEFTAEVEVLSSIRHANIVKLMCCISSDKSKLLVYEYMENQSLDRWLHGKKRKATQLGTNSVHDIALNWSRRLEISIGAAQGLCYMHHDCSPPIIHRDVKSSNILLDSEFKARIADFGLAKILVKQGEAYTMSAIAGSFGYLAPEYAYTTKVNEKIDVFSFGVVLLELATGKEPNSGDESTNLAEWAWQHHLEGKPITEALDEEIKEPCYLEEMKTVFKVGLVCTSTVPSNRPSMKEVVQILRECSPSYGEKKKVGSEFDVAPLLGSGTHLSSYRKSKRATAEDGDSLV